MSAWLALLKAGLPYVADIVADRLPVFTKRKEEAKNTADLSSEQIAELQQAVQHNAASIKALAEQLQQTIQALEGAATEQEKEREFLRLRIRSARRLAMIAFGTAFLSLTFAILSNFV